MENCKCNEAVGSNILQVEEAGVWYWVRVCKHGVPVVWTPTFPPRGARRG